jgi:hypothetical protein
LYSQRTINQRVEALVARGFTTLPNHLEFSREYRREVVDHLDSLVIKNDKGRVVDFKRGLDPQEQTYIRNERQLCAISYLYWAENYHYIRQYDTLALIPFKQNFYQQVLTSVQAEMEDQGKPVLIQLGKARQGGGTTDTTSKIEQRALFVPNTSGLIASSDPEKSWKLSQMIDRSLKLQPWFLLPSDLKTYDSGETYLEVASQNTTITIQHGNQSTGIIRGDTVNAFHLSEIPDWGRQGKMTPEELIDSSLFGAWHPTPLHFGVMESTADGRHDFWHKRWLENKASYPIQQSLEQPLFLPYYLSPELYPTPAWLVSIPIPRAWKPPDFVMEHARRAQDYVRSDRVLRRVLGADWYMSLEMQWWWYFEYTKADKKDQLNIFLSQFPADDQEMFQSKSRGVFSIPLVQAYRSRIQNPVGVFKVTGDHIPTLLEPEAIELLDPEENQELTSLTPISITHESGEERLQWTLHPIKFPGYSSVKNHFETLWIWEYPQDNQDYCVSLDTGHGVGKDRTVLQVIKRGTPLQPTKQVARFSTPKLNGIEIMPVFLLLLNYYSPFSISRQDYSKALASPETNLDGGGTIAELLKHGWVNIYIRRDFAKRDIDPDKRTQWGWNTTPAARPILTSWIVTLLKGQFFDLTDPWTIDEMPDFVANESEISRKIRLEADTGAFDDHLISGGIGVVTLHDLDLLDSETPNFRAIIQHKKTLVKFAVFGDQDNQMKIRHPHDQLPTGKDDRHEEFDGAVMDWGTFDKFSDYRY